MVGGVASRWAFTAVVVLVVVQRLAELRLSRRNEERLRRRGAIEAGAGHYPWMVALHTAFLLSAPLEVWLLDRPFVPWLAGAMAVLLVAATALRYWTIRTLGERWTTRIVCLPGGAVETGGPFRYLRHPNYLAVTIEMLALPLLHTAWLTAGVFGLANGVLLVVRMRAEEAALMSHTAYREAFAEGPRRGGERDGESP
ncbi:MAG: isoprenylcysteine carboxylmethyltransferase family protein [Thermoanaerobaculia bacterium]|nr:isoprenylcysteine carboxylmethyltransferase family protein [Thermoanaerobaculia bacterium]